MIAALASGRQDVVVVIILIADLQRVVFRANPCLMAVSQVDLPEEGHVRHGPDPQDGYQYQDNVAAKQFFIKCPLGLGDQHQLLHPDIVDDVAEKGNCQNPEEPAKPIPTHNNSPI